MLSRQVGESRWREKSRKGYVDDGLCLNEDIEQKEKRLQAWKENARNQPNREHNKYLRSRNEKHANFQKVILSLNVL